jgi:hypothetical protein
MTDHDSFADVTCNQIAEAVREFNQGRVEEFSLTP